MPNRLEPEVISLLYFCRIEDDVIDILHLFLIYFLLGHRRGFVDHLGMRKGWGDVVAEVDVAAAFEFFEVVDDRLVDLFYTVHHDKDTYFIRVYFFNSHYVRDVLLNSC